MRMSKFTKVILTTIYKEIASVLPREHGGYFHYCGFDKLRNGVKDFRENITVMIFSSVNYSDGKGPRILGAVALYRLRRSK
jgi:predicted methyltransferase